MSGFFTSLFIVKMIAVQDSWSCILIIVLEKGEQHSDG